MLKKCVVLTGGLEVSFSICKIFISNDQLPSQRLTNQLERNGLEVIKLEYSLRFKIKRNDLLLADTCPQAPNLCALF